MNPGPTFTNWWIHSAAGGGLLLLLAWSWMRRGTQPAWRQRVGEWGLLAALLINVLALTPPWLLVPLLAANVPTSTADDRTHVTEPEPGSQDENEFPAEESTLFVVPIYPEQDQNLVGAVMPDSSVGAAPVSPAPDLSTPRSTPPAARAAQASDYLEASVGILALAYLSVAAFLLGRWLLGTFSLWHLLRGSRAAPLPVTRLFTEMSNARRSSARLLTSKRLRAPISCGLFRPTVVIPRSWCKRSLRPALRWVFAHELTHIERRDAWACVLFACGQVFYFYLPWFWWLRRQVRLCQEYVADAAAVEETGEAADYAQFLLSLTGSSAVPLGATGVLGNSSDLFRRVTMLLQSPVRADKRWSLGWSLVSVAVILSLSVLFSGISFRAATAATNPTPTNVTVTVTDDQSAAKPAEGEKAKEAPVVALFANRDEDPSDDAGSQREKQLREKIKNLREQLRNIEKEMQTEQPARKLLKRVEVLGDQPMQVDNLLKKVEVLGDQPMQKALNAYALALQHTGGRLGVRIQKPSADLADQLDLPKGEGIVIEEVTPNSAAAKAGLKAHDILIEFNDKPVTNDPEKLVQAIEKIKANTPVDAVVLRKGKRETIRGISLPERKASEPLTLWNKGQTFDFQGGGKPFAVWKDAAPSFESAAPFFAFSTAGRQGVITTIFRNNDRFTTRHQEGSLVITLTGTVADGKTKINKIAVQDGGTSHAYQSIEDVPEQYRDKVKNLVEMNDKGNVKIEIRTEEKRKSTKKKSKDDDDDD
jgi:beta-lactamase regulating signal transducer with metallopeptidase domain